MNRVLNNVSAFVSSAGVTVISLFKEAYTLGYFSGAATVALAWVMVWKEYENTLYRRAERKIKQAEARQKIWELAQLINDDKGNSTPGITDKP